MVAAVLSNFKHLWQTVAVDIVDAAAILRREPEHKSLLLVHLDVIGDYLLFRNFIRVVRRSKKYSGYTITLCGNEQYRDLAERLDSEDVDDFIWLDRQKFRYDIAYRFRMVRHISKRGFFVAIHSAGSRVYYWGDSVIRACRGAERVGCAGDTINIKPWQKKWSDRFYTRLIPVGNPCLFEFNRNKEFFEKLLSEPVDVAKPFVEAGKIPAAPFPERPYAVLFPGAGAPFRRWAEEKFARIADHLHEHYKYVVVIAGSIGDRELAQRISSSAKRAKPIDLTGKTALPELAGLIANAELLVSNETGAVHMAAAVNTKVVCISNGNQFGRFSPYPPDVFSMARYIFPREIRERYDDFAGLCESFARKSDLDINGILVETVVEQIDAILSKKMQTGAKGPTCSSPS
jgi:ADP-heptose:LPS heptosyltransferase